MYRGQVSHCVVFVFQLSCCGKGVGTSFLTQLTDKLGVTDLCPSSGTTVVSVIIHLSSFLTVFMHQQPGQAVRLCST